MFEPIAIAISQVGDVVLALERMFGQTKSIQRRARYLKCWIATKAKQTLCLCFAMQHCLLGNARLRTKLEYEA